MNVSDTTTTPISNFQDCDPLMQDRAGNGRLRMTGAVVSSAALSEQTRGEMLTLLQRHFDGVSREQFTADLEEKDWVVLLRQETTGELFGFTSLMTITAEHQGETFQAFFSGDTILRPEAWGSPLLMRLWLRFVFAQTARMESRQPVYWFLICSGYKTYRFLPLLMRRYVPAPAGDDPRLQALRDAFATRKFSRSYDAGSGIIRLAQPAPLKEGLAEITPPRLRNRDIAFFLAQNPGHREGDELACLAELSWANLTGAGRRLVGANG